MRSAQDPKDALQPNPHPYPIKTTSTGLLSRSTTAPGAHSYAPSHYVPPSPGHSPTKPSKHGVAHAHRYSRSLTTSSLPRPLPIPPSPTRNVDRDGAGSPFLVPHRTKRAETLPNSPHGDKTPDHPRQWTPSQVSQYLLPTHPHDPDFASSDANHPTARDLAAFVCEHNITGKRLLSLDEETLNGYALSPPWRAALLLAARSLRQTVVWDSLWPDVAGPAWGGGRADDRDGEAEEEAHLSSASSTSSISCYRGRRGGPAEPGRVRGMVASLERSSSVDEGTSPTRGGQLGFSTRRERSGSVSSASSRGDDDEGYGWDLGADGDITAGGSKRGRPLPFLPSATFPDAGRPYSGQFQEVGRADEDEEISTGLLPVLTGHGSGTRRHHGLEDTVERQSAPPTIPPAASMPPETHKAYPGDEEMSIEELLSALNGKGAEAWEMDKSLGATVKRIPAGQAAVAVGDIHRGHDEAGAVNMGESTRSGKGKSEKIGSVGGAYFNASGKEEGQEVDRNILGMPMQGSDIPWYAKAFGGHNGGGASEENVDDILQISEETGPQVQMLVEPPDVDAPGGVVVADKEALASADTDESDLAWRKLEEDVAETRRIVDDLCERLEGVEQRMEEMEQKAEERKSTAGVVLDGADRDTPQGAAERAGPEETGRSSSYASALTQWIPQMFLENFRTHILGLTVSMSGLGLGRGSENASEATPQSDTTTSYNSYPAVSTDVPATSKPTVRRRYPREYDPRMSPLPRYVLLVGIGVCAVMLRAVMRRAWALGMRVGLGSHIRGRLGEGRR